MTASGCFAGAYALDWVHGRTSEDGATFGEELERIGYLGETPPGGFRPWFEFRNDACALACGHWSALGLKLQPRLAALDTGCVWGGALSALRLEDRWLVQVPSPGYQPIKEER